MNYKEEVLKVYPDAECEMNADYYYIHVNGRKISGCWSVVSAAWESAYQSLPTPTTITVTGCADCILSNYDSEYEVYSCNHKKGYKVENYSDAKGKDILFSNCPLKTSPITIMLKK